MRAKDRTKTNITDEKRNRVNAVKRKNTISRYLRQPNRRSQLELAQLHRDFVRDTLQPK